MDVKREKFTINSYVVYKIGQECYEGRVKSIIGTGNSEIFTIYSFTTFTDQKIACTDILSNVSQEIKRKLKTTSFIELPNVTNFPPELKSVLIVDKEWSTENKYDLPQRVTVEMILNSFKEFIVIQAKLADTDEAFEVTRAFILSFNFFFPLLLIYENEKTQIFQMKARPSEYCGPVHLLRLLYYLQKETRFYISDLQTKHIILDYTVYLLDFMMLRFKDYF